jgi:hypothetical protein
MLLMLLMRLHVLLGWKPVIRSIFDLGNLLR